MIFAVLRLLQEWEQQTRRFVRSELMFCEGRVVGSVVGGCCLERKLVAANQIKEIQQQPTIWPGFFGHNSRIFG